VLKRDVDAFDVAEIVEARGQLLDVREGRLAGHGPQTSDAVYLPGVLRLGRQRPGEETRPYALQESATVHPEIKLGLDLGPVGRPSAFRA